MDIYNGKSVSQFLAGHGVRLSKSMGQNFLIDANIPEKIVRLAGFGMEDGVLEVGPGLGMLTAKLSSAAGRVTAVELDKRLLPILQESLGGMTNVELVQGDILKLNVGELVLEHMPGLRHHVCANLPYNITSDALKLFLGAGVFETVTVMIQREVAQRICAKPGTSEYGAFTIFVNYYMKPELLFDVPPECFFPRPGVFSSVAAMRRIEGRGFSHAEEALFFRVVRAAFAQRRKTLVNALYAVFGNILGKDEIAAAVRSCGFDERLRGEVLGIDEFARLSSLIGKHSAAHSAEKKVD